jgi:FKBP-type peptidyl-prolyl cis-trans isomerase 2
MRRVVRTARGLSGIRLKVGPAESGDVVQISFETRNEKAEVLDRGTDVRIRIGDPAVLPKLSQQLIGSVPGSRLKFTVKPGSDRPDLIWDSRLVQRVSKEKINIAEEGVQNQSRVIVFDGKKDVPATVLDQNKYEVVLDFNHPAAQKVSKLEFDVRFQFNYGPIPKWNMRKDRIMKFKQSQSKEQLDKKTRELKMYISDLEEEE